MIKVEATAIIEFGDVDPSTVIAIIELDDDKNVDAEGNVLTSFPSQAIIFFKLHLSKGIDIVDLVATSGTIQARATTSTVEEEQEIFSSRDADEPSMTTLQYIPSGKIAISYIGRNGKLTGRQSSNGSFEYTADIGYTPFIADLVYSYTSNSYALYAPKVDLAEGETYPIAIVAYLKLDSDGGADGCSS